MFRSHVVQEQFARLSKAAVTRADKSRAIWMLKHGHRPKRAVVTEAPVELPAMELSQKPGTDASVSFASQSSPTKPCLKWWLWFHRSLRLATWLPAHLLVLYLVL
jgi:hypothetical protein